MRLQRIATLSNVISLDGLTATGSFVYNPLTGTIVSSSVVVNSNQFPSFSATLNDLVDSSVKSTSACCASGNNKFLLTSILLTSSNPQSNMFYVNGAEAILNLPSLPSLPGTYQLISDFLENDPTHGAASSTLGGSNCGSGVVPCFDNGSVLTSGSLVITQKP